MSARYDDDGKGVDFEPYTELGPVVRDLVSDVLGDQRLVHWAGKV